MYMSETNEVGLADARRTLAELVHAAAVRNQITYLTSRGRRIAALVPVAIAEDNDPTENEEN